MEQYIIKGGVPLCGEVSVSGAKNAALGILAAAVMSDEDVRIENLPNVSDINIMIEAASHIGAAVQRVDDHTVIINGSGITDRVITDEFLTKIRASYYFIGALLGKYREATVPLPGGCDIGARPIDQHIKGFTALGADVKIENGNVVARADTLKGTHLYFDLVSVGATINVMLAASMAEGTTILENVAKEPHIVDVANLLNSMGAKIRGAGTDTIRIRGVSKLHGTTYTCIPDQIETGTFMCMAAITKGDVIIKNVIPKHMESISAKIREMGNTVIEGDDFIRVIGTENPVHTDIKTLPYPGFPTDMQSQITVALGLAQGMSVITESIFENRFKYVDELIKMGAQMRVEGSVAIVSGVRKYYGAAVSAADLRGCAALVIAGLAADGFTTVDNINFVKRGYESFAKKIRGLGGLIREVHSDEEIEEFKAEVE